MRRVCTTDALPEFCRCLRSLQTTSGADGREPWIGWDPWPSCTRSRHLTECRTLRSQPSSMTQGVPGEAIFRTAAAHGCPWVNGRDMHSGQIEAIMAFFHPDAQRAASAG